jgi:hypothetical protein
VAFAAIVATAERTVDTCDETANTCVSTPRRGQLSHRRHYRNGIVNPNDCRSADAMAPSAWTLRSTSCDDAPCTVADACNASEGTARPADAATV